jgi:hypothetical protein
MILAGSARGMNGSSEARSSRELHIHRQRASRVSTQSRLTIVDEDGLSFLVKVHKHCVEQRSSDVETRVDVESEGGVDTVSRSSSIWQFAVVADVLGQLSEGSTL